MDKIKELIKLLLADFELENEEEIIGVSDGFISLRGCLFRTHDIAGVGFEGADVEWDVPFEGSWDALDDIDVFLMRCLLVFIFS